MDRITKSFPSRIITLVAIFAVVFFWDAVTAQFMQTPITRIIPKLYPAKYLDCATAFFILVSCIYLIHGMAVYIVARGRIAGMGVIMASVNSLCIFVVFWFVNSGWPGHLIFADFIVAAILGVDAITSQLIGSAKNQAE